VPQLFNPLLYSRPPFLLRSLPLLLLVARLELFLLPELSRRIFLLLAWMPNKYSHSHNRNHNRSSQNQPALVCMLPQLRVAKVALELPPVRLQEQHLPLLLPLLPASVCMLLVLVLPQQLQLLLLLPPQHLLLLPLLLPLQFLLLLLSLNQPQLLLHSHHTFLLLRLHLLLHLHLHPLLLRLLSTNWTAFSASWTLLLLLHSRPPTRLLLLLPLPQLRSPLETLISMT